MSIDLTTVYAEHSDTASRATAPYMDALRGSSMLAIASRVVFSSHLPQMIRKGLGPVAQSWIVRTTWPRHGTSTGRIILTAYTSICEGTVRVPSRASSRIVRSPPAACGPVCLFCLSTNTTTTYRG